MPISLRISFSFSVVALKLQDIHKILMQLELIFLQGDR
jgi:hypothetical protein